MPDLSAVCLVLKAVVLLDKYHHISVRLFVLAFQDAAEMGQHLLLGQFFAFPIQIAHILRRFLGVEAVEHIAAPGILVPGGRVRFNMV